MQYTKCQYLFTANYELDSTDAAVTCVQIVPALE